MTLIIILIVVIGTMAFFYLKCSMMRSFTTLWSSVLSLILAFSYYEIIAELFISRGFGFQWAHAGAIMIVFLVGFAILWTLSDLLIRIKIDLGPTVAMTAKIICGLLTGFLFSGIALTALGLLPLQGMFSYSRFDPEKPLEISDPKKPKLNPDGFASGLYHLASAGSLSSGKSFGVLHADYLTQIHLNKFKIKDDVLPVSSHKALMLPKGKDRKPLRLWDVPEVGEVLVIRAGIAAKKIEDGGANDGTGSFNFFPAQLRLISKTDSTIPPFSGTGKVLYPKGFLNNGTWTQIDLTKVISPDQKKMKDRIYWFDVAFEVPSGQKPVLLQFKQSAIADLTPYTPVKTSAEIEAALDSDEEKPSAP